MVEKSKPSKKDSDSKRSDGRTFIGSRAEVSSTTSAERKATPRTTETTN